MRKRTARLVTTQLRVSETCFRQVGVDWTAHSVERLELVMGVDPYHLFEQRSDRYLTDRSTGLGEMGERREIQLVADHHVDVERQRGQGDQSARWVLVRR